MCLSSLTIPSNFCAFCSVLNNTYTRLGQTRLRQWTTMHTKHCFLLYYAARVEAAQLMDWMLSYALHSEQSFHFIFSILRCDSSSISIKLIWVGVLFTQTCAVWLISPWACLWLILSNISYHQWIPNSPEILTYICQQIQVISVHIGKIWVSLRSYSHFIKAVQKKAIKMKSAIAYHLLERRNSWNIWWPSISSLQIK